MQERDTCKLLCCLSGKPVPTVKWYKDKRELSKYEYSMSQADGVVTMEIVDCRPEDSGNYSCVATNCHGSDDTSCVVIVEGATSTEEQTRLANKIMHSGDRKFIEQPLKPAPQMISTHKTVTSSNKSSTNYSSTNRSTNINSHLNSDEVSSRTQKKYGSKLDTTGSPSRSRSATKELACEYSARS